MGVGVDEGVGGSVGVWIVPEPVTGTADAVAETLWVYPGVAISVSKCAPHTQSLSLTGCFPHRVSQCGFPGPIVAPAHLLTADGSVYPYTCLSLVKVFENPS